MRGESKNDGSPPAPLLSIVVPCYNEEKCLDTLVERAIGAARLEVGEDFELVLVNDGSRDRTWELISSYATRLRHVVGVKLSRNHGHQLALTAGLSVARGARIFVVDADLQDPPELLGPMMQRMSQGFDVVYGQRRHRHGESVAKRVTARIFYRLLARLTDTSIPLDTGDFRLMTRRAVDVLLSMPEAHRFVRGMVSWIGFPQTAFVYDRAERYAGETKYPFAKMLRLAIDAITGFSTAPLRLATHLGLALAACSTLVLVYVLVGWLRGEAVQGWASVMSVMLIIGSVQLLVMGVIGEYLGRVYVEVKRRPVFIIEEISSGARDSLPLPSAIAAALSAAPGNGELISE